LVTKILSVVPNFVAVTKPFLPCIGKAENYPAKSYSSVVKALLALFFLNFFKTEFSDRVFDSRW